MKKRILSLMLVLALSLAAAAPALADAAPYSDVPEEHWAAGSIRRATELGIFNGVGGGQFGLGQPITRAAFVTALVRLFGWETEEPDGLSYTDVPAQAWYCAAVETARANGALVTTGSSFRPEDNITREEMTVMIVRGLGYAPLAGAVSSYSAPFNDVTTNRGFITVAYDLGIVSGVGDGQFDPSGTATREQAAAMLVRVCDKLRLPSQQLEEAEGISLRVESPQAKEGDALPTTPLEPMTELYTALRELKRSGTDMSGVTLCLAGGGVSTLVSGGRIVDSERLSAEAVTEILAEGKARLYYSRRHESAYLIYQPNTYQTATVWYQSEESLAVKLRLGRLFGVTKYILE